MLYFLLNTSIFALLAENYQYVISGVIGILAILGAAIPKMRKFISSFLPLKTSIPDTINRLIESNTNLITEVSNLKKAEAEQTTKLSEYKSQIEKLTYELQEARKEIDVIEHARIKVKIREYLQELCEYLMCDSAQVWKFRNTMYSTDNFGYKFIFVDEEYVQPSALKGYKYYDWYNEKKERREFSVSDFAEAIIKVSKDKIVIFTDEDENDVMRAYNLQNEIKSSLYVVIQHPLNGKVIGILTLVYNDKKVTKKNYKTEDINFIQKTVDKIVASYLYS